MKSSLRLLTLFAVAASTACGFTCRIDGEEEYFDSCDALQERFDEEQGRLDEPPDNAVLDDLQVCGEISNCEVKP